MLTLFELFGPAFLFIWCGNGVSTTRFLALHTWVSCSAALSAFYVYTIRLWSDVFSTYLLSQTGKSKRKFSGAENDKSMYLHDRQI